MFLKDLISLTMPLISILHTENMKELVEESYRVYSCLVNVNVLPKELLR